MATPRTHATNRGLLGLLGVLLLAGAVLALLLSFGLFGSGRAGRPVLDPSVSDFADRYAPVFWPVAAVVAVLVGLLALRWLLAQLGSRRVGSLDVEPDRSRGSTHLSTRAVTDAVTGEIEGMRGVQSARAHFVGDGEHPDLDLTVTVDERADLAAVRRRIEETTVRHAREALDQPDLPVHLRVKLAPRRQRQLT